MTQRILPAVLSLVLAAASGCSSPPPPACTLGTSTGCAAGEWCEVVAGNTQGTCFTQLHVRGHVIDAIDAHGIAAARVLALDVNGAAVSSVVVSGADGSYDLPVPAARDAAGVPSSAAITLRVSASGYQTFAVAPRSALPIDLSSAVVMDMHPTVTSSATDVALIPHAGSGITISGDIVGDDGAGVLVVAEQGGTAVATTLSDLDGSFVLFDVPAGMVHVSGFRAGLRITPVDVVAAAPGVDAVMLVVEAGALGTVTGSLNIVSAPGASSTTSVILVVESTFVMNAARGEAPPGLRAGDVANAFTIDHVPPGRYVVLASFENDGLVRDPDAAIGGTTIQHVEVPATGGPVAIAESFKVTGALVVMSPGGSMLETVTTASPTLVWADDSSEDGYEVRVFDAFGNQVLEDLAVPNVSGSGSVTYHWTPATALTPGMIYQFRATSWRTGHGGVARTYISATEDLRGVFEYRP
jgi:hypothetical protein